MNSDRLLAALVGGFLVYLWLDHEYKNGTWPTDTMYGSGAPGIGGAVNNILDAAGYPASPNGQGGCQ